jgi:DNA-binding response OmpR family regulator
VATNSEAADSEAADGDEILVAEHDQAVAELIRRSLAREGLRVRAARTAAETAEELANCRAAVVVLDLTMPGLDARQIRRMIRPGPAASARTPAARRGRPHRHRGHPTVRGPAADVPVICLIPGEGSHAAQGLRPRDAGVDPGACLARPFGPRTLVDRVRAAARSVQPRPVPGSISAGRLSVHPASRRATLDGAEIPLTSTEFDVLSCLARSAGRAVPRAALRAAVWGAGSDGAGSDGAGSGGAGSGAAAPGDRIVDVYIAQLRTKIGPIHGIRTVRGVGYVLDEIAHDGTLNPGGQSGAQEPPATIGDAGHPSRGDSGNA